MMKEITSPNLLCIHQIPYIHKHGAGKSPHSCWIKIMILVEGRRLTMQVSNSLPNNRFFETTNVGIGQANVKRRLKLLFAGQSALTIQADENQYSVRMSVPLQQVA